MITFQEVCKILEGVFQSLSENGYKGVDGKKGGWNLLNMPIRAFQVELSIGIFQENRGLVEMGRVIP